MASPLKSPDRSVIAKSKIKRKPMLIILGSSLAGIPFCEFELLLSYKHLLLQTKLKVNRTALNLYKKRFEQK